MALGPSRVGVFRLRSRLNHLLTFTKLLPVAGRLNLPVNSPQAGIVFTLAYLSRFICIYRRFYNQLIPFRPSAAYRYELEPPN